MLPPGRNLKCVALSRRYSNGGTLYLKATDHFKAYLNTVAVLHIQLCHLRKGNVCWLTKNGVVDAATIAHRLASAT